MRYRRHTGTPIQIVALAAMALCAISCTRNKQAVPDVVGIPFAVPLSHLDAYLPDGEHAETYSILSIHGYKLAYPNPEAWTVFVQVDSDDILDDLLWRIAITKELPAECQAQDTKEVLDAVEAKYADLFSDSMAYSSDTGEGATFVAVSERRMLTAAIGCWLRSVSGVFDYVDLDQFRYRDPSPIRELLSNARREVADFPSRSLR